MRDHNEKIMFHQAGNRVETSDASSNIVLSIGPTMADAKQRDRMVTALNNPLVLAAIKAAFDETGT